MRKGSCKRLIKVMAMLLACLLVLSGCGGGSGGAASSSAAVSAVQSRPEPAPEPVPEPEPEPEPEPYVPSGVNPLTGMPIEEEYEPLRPVAVMLNNLKAAQPQLGTSLADIIYEVPAEGGITRMLAVYQSLESVEKLGSIRSARPYYVELAMGHDALYVHAGGSPDAYSVLSSWDTDNMDGVNGGRDAEIFWRDKERRKTMDYEHTLVTDGKSIREYVDGHFRTEHKESYAYPQTFADDGTPAGGAEAKEVKLQFSNYKTGCFNYDAGSGKYLVSQYGGAYVDGNTGEQVSVTNVLVLETAISIISGDKEGRLTVDLTGSGKGTYFCGGKAVPIRWSKNSRNEPFVYTLESGSPLVMGKGSSYVCIISPKTSTLSYS